MIVSAASSLLVEPNYRKPQLQITRNQKCICLSGLEHLLVLLIPQRRSYLSFGIGVSAAVHGKVKTCEFIPKISYCIFANVNKFSKMLWNQMFVIVFMVATRRPAMNMSQTGSVKFCWAFAVSRSTFIQTTLLYPVKRKLFSWSSFMLVFWNTSMLALMQATKRGGGLEMR